MNRRACIFFAVFLSAFFLFPVYTQSETDWYVNKPITEIRFTGLERTPQNDLDGITSTYIGRPFTDQLYQRLLQSLYNLEYFEYLIPEAIPSDDSRSGVIIVFEVLERPIIGQIEYQGERRVRESQIREVTLVRLGDIYSMPSIRADVEAIRTLYLEKGYPAVTIEPVVSDMTNGDKRVVFEIQEGPQTTVRTIQFEGIVFGTAAALKAVLHTKEQGIFNSGVFSEQLLEADRESLTAYYESNGFVDVEIIDIRTEATISDDGLQSSMTLTYVIAEGERWTFGGITFTGNEIFSDDIFNAKLSLDPGDVLDLVEFRTALQEIVDIYYQNGYFNNEVGVDETRDEEQQSISYEMVIVERPRSYIENIVIQGNEKTSEHVILRELPFEPGEVFSASKIREGLLNIYNLQYFEGVPLIETPQGSEPELRDVVITVVEQNTLDTRGGFSVGGGEGFPLAIIASVSDINFLGNGQSLGVDLNLSSSTQSLTARFSDSYLFGDRIGGGINLTLEHTRQGNEPQDIHGPVFFGDEPNAVPDPFTGEYIVTKIPTGETVYEIGDVFLGEVNDTNKATYGLMTDYHYAGGAAMIPSSYLMEYDVYNLSLGFSTSIRKSTPIGWIGFGANINTALNFIEYDAEIYRPFSSAIRENLGTFRLINRLGMNVSLDSRDVYFNPSSGYYFSQGFTFTGGILFGNRHYIRSDTGIQGYFTLLHAGEEPIGNWRLILAMNTSLSLMLPQFWTLDGESDNFVPGENLLYTNGMTVARGWPTASQGEALFNNWIELRMPIVESVVWFDMYAEAARLTRDRNDIFAAGGDGWMFGFGAGLRLVIPQLPIRLYLAKRFSIVDGSVVWQDGNLFPGEDGEGKGIDLIFAISLFN